MLVNELLKEDQPSLEKNISKLAFDVGFIPNLFKLIFKCIEFR